MDQLRDTRSFSFLGITSRQYWVDLFVWESWFTIAKSRGLRQFIELGTGRGALSLYFQAQAIQRAFHFETFDNADEPPEAVETRLGKLLRLGDHCTRMDLLSGDPKALIKLFEHPLCLFCDNGNKKEEVRRFAPELRAGDWLAVHDWGIEIGPEDIPAGFSMWSPWLQDELGGITRIFLCEGAP